MRNKKVGVKHIFKGDAIPASTNVTGTANFSIVGGKLRYAPSASPFSIVRFDDFTTCLDDVEIEILVNVISTGSITTTSFGFQFGLYTVNPYDSNTNGSIGGGIRTITTNLGGLYLRYWDGTVVQSNTFNSETSALNVIANDQVLLRLTVKAQNYQMYGKNLRTGVEARTPWGYMNTTNNLMGNVPPAWKLFLNAGAGTYDFSYIKTTCIKPNKNHFIVLGDSITDKSYATYQWNAYAYKLVEKANKNGKHAQVVGMPSYTSADMLPYVDGILRDLSPKYVVCLIGANDANGNGGATPATWSTNFQQIITKIVAFGSTPIICKVTPRPSGGFNTAVNTINSSIDSLYGSSGYKIINTNTPMAVGGVSTTLNFDADLLHPNDTGMNVLFTTINAAAPELFV